eukprot:4139199-Karenia_brevis.AAC.1
MDPMAPFGPVSSPLWTPMDRCGPYGPLWTPMDPYGTLLTPMDPYGTLWNPMDPMAPYGLLGTLWTLWALWTFMEAHRPLIAVQLPHDSPEQ